jgi:hypothetical protein
MNFEDIGSPLAKVVFEKNPKKSKIISVDSNNSSVREVLSEYRCLPAETIQQLPNKKAERQILYVTGASGSGKSYYTMNYVNEYKKMYPKNELFLLSSVEPDGSAIDKIKGLRRFKLDEAFIKEQFTINDFKNCLLVMDDCDCISSKVMKAKIKSILDLVLDTGRHTNTSMIYTSHIANAGMETKHILSEAHSITIFPKTLGGRAMKYLLDNYLGLDKQQIKKLKRLDSRWVTVIKSYPMIVIGEKQAFMLNNDEDSD